MECIQIKTAKAILEKTSETAKNYNDCMNGITTAISVLSNESESKESKFTIKEQKILNLIHNVCNNDCGERLNCPEEECKLWQIEQIIKGKGGS